MIFKASTDKRQWFLTPAIGLVDMRNYYGYPVWSLGFAWLCWRFCVKFGIKRWRNK